MEKKEPILLEEKEVLTQGKPLSPKHALESSGHYTCDYPNGLCLGVRFEAITGTRGVHVDVAHVLDLRKAEFGKSGLAMRAALLEVVNRPLQNILSDVGLGGLLEEKTLPTPFGKVPLLLMESLSGTGSSLVHETRTIYVVREDTRTSLNLSWLTDSSRIIAASDLPLARRSDIRAMLPSLRGKIVDRKWSLLESSIRKGWLGVIALMGVIVGLVAFLFASSIGSESFLVPLLTMVVSSMLGGVLLSSSKKSLTEFKRIVSSEEEDLAYLGDRKSIDQSIADNEEQLRLLGDISFVVSPLMALVGLAIETGEIDEAANNACQILDECVRLAPLSTKKGTNSVVVSDEGLRRFLGLFDALGVKVSEEDVALAYVGLTGHPSNPLSFSELVSHVETLNNTLFNAGILRPDIKESVDDRINKKAMEAVIEAFDESTEDEGRESPSLKPQDPPPPVAEENESTTDDELNPEFLSEIRESSVSGMHESAPSVNKCEDLTPVVIAQTVPEPEEHEEMPSAAGVLSSQKKKRQKDEDYLVQSSLFESVTGLMELGKDSATKEEEGGPAGA
ncbi:MAG: hypothetical protein EAX95_15790 [Candidatus Thorarchaeota archaeon]|nr:hypothetical protein [Candidatus Thorarchaeota archaeon]